MLLMDPGIGIVRLILLFQYETFVASELVTWVDNKYKTIKNRTGRAITGLSMGGHGALYLAFRHYRIFLVRRVV